MATVSVATWAELTTAVNNATEDTTVELTSDIDMNDEFPTGVTTGVGGSSYKFIINGNGHKIKNLYANSINGVLHGRTGYIMEINNLDFENAYLTNSAKLGTSVEWRNCLFSIKLENSEIGSGKFYYCGLAVTGFGTSYLAYGSSNATFYFCNIEVNGEFANLSCVFNDTYVKGNCTAGASTVKGRLVIINATIAFTGNFNYDGAAQLILYNSDTITVPSGSTISAKLIPCTTAELMSDSALRAKSFPMW